MRIRNQIANLCEVGCADSVITRTLASKIESMAGTFPVVTLACPRQSGKTTLCRMVFRDHRYVSLEVRDFAELLADAL